MARPSPVPSCSRLARSDWANLVNSLSRKSAGIPGPRSRTAKSTPASRDETTRSTSLPPGENLSALESRFVSTCTTRSQSARKRGRPGARLVRTTTPTFFANPSMPATASAQRRATSCSCRSSCSRPASILLTSRMSFTSRTRRSALRFETCTSSAVSPSSSVSPSSRSAIDALMLVSGVRSSCETVEMNSVFILSTSRSRVTSSNTPIHPIGSPPIPATFAEYARSTRGLGSPGKCTSSSRSSPRSGCSRRTGLTEASTAATGQPVSSWSSSAKRRRKAEFTKATRECRSTSRMPLRDACTSASICRVAAWDFSLSARTSWMSCAPAIAVAACRARMRRASSTSSRKRSRLHIATTPTRRPSWISGYPANDLSRSMRAQSGSASPGSWSRRSEVIMPPCAATRPTEKSPMGTRRSTRSRGPSPPWSTRWRQLLRFWQRSASSQVPQLSPGPTSHTRAAAAPRLRVSASVTAARMRSRWNALETFSTTRSAPRSARTVASRRSRSSSSSSRVRAGGAGAGRDPGNGMGRRALTDPGCCSPRRAARRARTASSGSGWRPGAGLPRSRPVAPWR